VADSGYGVTTTFRVFPSPSLMKYTPGANRLTSFASALDRQDRQRAGGAIEPRPLSGPESSRGYSMTNFRVWLPASLSNFRM
jgi:hypothetical protein